MFTCWPFFCGEAEVNRTIQLHLAATHFPECSAQEMRGLEIRWKQNLEKRRKEEEEVTCRRLLWCVCCGGQFSLISWDGYGSPIIQKTVFRVNINLPAILITREPRYQGFDRRMCMMSGAKKVTSADASIAWRLIMPNLGWFDLASWQTTLQRSQTSRNSKTLPVLVKCCLILFGIDWVTIYIFK